MTANTLRSRRLGNRVLPAALFFLSSLRSFHRSGRLVDGLRPLRQEPVSDAIKVGQRQEREYPGRVLGQTPVANFDEAPQPLDDEEEMFDERPGLRPALVARFLGFGQGGGPRPNASAGASAHRAS